MDKKWIIGVFGGVFGFLVAQYMGFYTFTKNVEVTKNIEMINLGQELAQTFYKEEEKTFYKIRMAIEQCKKLYIGFDKEKGQFNNDEINRYLGFFDDVGFYYRKGVIDIDIVDQFFGAYIIEAYEYNELRRYISETQENAKQKGAFVEFKALAEALEKIPEQKELAELSRRACQQ